MKSTTGQPDRIPWGQIYWAGHDAYLEGFRWGWLWATIHLLGVDTPEADSGD